MASELFIFVATDREARLNRELTIERPVRLEQIEPHAANVAARLRASGHREVRCWGSVPGRDNNRNWRRMKPGDWALLYGGDREFPWLFRVGDKARSKRLARSLWGEDPKGRTWELMFFFDFAQRVDLGLSDVREALGHENERWFPRGLGYPAAERQAALLEKFGSFPALASAAPSPPAEAPPPSLEELLMGNKPKRGKTKQPKLRQARLPPDPDRSGRGYMAHEATVKKLNKYIGPTIREGTREINHDGAWKVGSRFHICEVKSVTPKNEVEQLQKGLGQILHNRFKAQRRRKQKVNAYLIAEREPSNSALWIDLAAEHGVVFTWPERFETDVERP